MRKPRRASLLLCGVALCILSQECSGIFPNSVKEPRPSLVAEVDGASWENFLSTLRPEENVLMEFYANWCPHCKHFKPKYDKVGNFFMSLPRPEPVVWVARLDCANATKFENGILNADLCNDFEITKYPTVRLGTAGQFREQQASELVSVEERESAKIVSRLGVILKGNYSYDDKIWDVPQQNVASTGRREENNTVMDVGDAERATTQIFNLTFETESLLTSKSHRQALSDLLYLLGTAHPSRACQTGAWHLYSSLEKLWPPSNDLSSEEIRKYRICSKKVDDSAVDWGSCKGSVEGSRGFTCGVWTLFHSLASRVADGPHGVKAWKSGVTGYVGSFFGCQHCAEHFLKILETLDVEETTTKRGLVLWLWKVHNQVNARLAREELADGTGDPDFPKIQWPLDVQCPGCRSEGDSEGENWNEDAVYAFLEEFYSGSAPISLPDKVVLPSNKASEVQQLNRAMGGRFSLKDSAFERSGSAKREAVYAQGGGGGSTLYPFAGVLIIVAGVVISMNGGSKKASRFRFSKNAKQSV